jgi:hypothetical protein
LRAVRDGHVSFKTIGARESKFLEVGTLKYVPSGKINYQSKSIPGQLELARLEQDKM